MIRYLLLFRILFIIIVIFETADWMTEASSLTCYECEEAFTDGTRWDPYTDCQVRPNNTGLKECLPSEVYCMVERVKIKHITISIKRQCTKECWFGCRAKGFGVTRVMCTSCCQTPACNTDNKASNLSSFTHRTLLLITIIISWIFRQH